MRDFNACYLLHSKHPQTRDRTYIGFTVNPKRRIKQHNGVISQGAFKTSKWRPWEMLLVVYGFPTQVHALQFEWAWQHPTKSSAVKGLAKQLGKKGLTGVKGKLQLMLGMLSLPPWCFYPLTVQYMSTVTASKAAGLVAPPPHVKVVIAPLEDLPSVLHDDEQEAQGSEGLGVVMFGLEGEEGGEEEEGGGTQMSVGGGYSLDTMKQGKRSKLSAGSTLLGPSGAGAGSQPAGGGSGDTESEQSSDGEGQGEDGEEAEQMPAGLTPEMIAPPNGKQWMCDICHKPIQRHVLHCSCRCGFHLECLATQWLIQSNYDPLSNNPVPSYPQGSGTELLSASQAATTSVGGARGKGRGSKAGRGAAGGSSSAAGHEAGAGNGEAGGGGGAPPGGRLPEQGCCPSCGKRHKWLDLLSLMLPYGYPIKPRKRRKRKTKQLKAAGTSSRQAATKTTTTTTKAAGSSRGRKAASKTAAGGESEPLAAGSTRGRKAASKTTATAAAGRAGSSSRSSSRGKAAAGVVSSDMGSDDEFGVFDMASLPTPKSSKRPRARARMEVEVLSDSDADSGGSKGAGGAAGKGRMRQEGSLAGPGTADMPAAAAATAPGAAVKRPRGRPRKVISSDDDDNAAGLGGSLSPTAAAAAAGHTTSRARPPSPVPRSKPGVEVLWDAYSSTSASSSSPGRRRRQKGCGHDEAQRSGDAGGHDEVLRSGDAGGGSKVGVRRKSAGSGGVGGAGIDVGVVSDVGELDTASKDSSMVLESVIPAPVKRQRGRPRKSPVVDDLPAPLPQPVPAPVKSRGSAQQGPGSGGVLLSSDGGSPGGGDAEQAAIPAPVRSSRGHRSPRQPKGMADRAQAPTSAEQASGLPAVAGSGLSEQQLPASALLPASLQERLRQRLAGGGGGAVSMDQPVATLPPPPPLQPPQPLPLPLDSQPLEPLLPRVLPLRERLQMRMQAAQQLAGGARGLPGGMLQQQQQQQGWQPVDSVMGGSTQQCVGSRQARRHQLSEPPPTLFALQPGVATDGGNGGHVVPSSLQQPDVVQQRPAGSTSQHASGAIHPGDVQPTDQPPVAISPAPPSTAGLAGPVVRPASTKSHASQEQQPCAGTSNKTASCQDSGVPQAVNQPSRMPAHPCEDGTPGEAEQPDSVPCSAGLPDMGSPKEQIGQGLPACVAQRRSAHLLIDLTKTPAAAARIPSNPGKPDDVEVVYISEEDE